MSRNATASSVRLTIVAGISPATILQNRQSAMGSSPACGDDERRRRERRGLVTQGEGAERDCQIPCGPESLDLLPGQAALGADDYGYRLRIQPGRPRHAPSIGQPSDAFRRGLEERVQAHRIGHLAGPGGTALLERLDRHPAQLLDLAGSKPA